MIRYASPVDLSAMILMSKDMHAESPEFSRIKWEEDVVAYHGLNCICHSDKLALISCDEKAVRGMLTASIVPHLFSRETMAIDSVVYVRPEFRGNSDATRMVKAFIEWGRAHGVSRIVMGPSTGVKTEKVKRFYERLGFAPSGDSLSMRV